MDEDVFLFLSTFVDFVHVNVQGRFCFLRLFLNLFSRTSDLAADGIYSGIVSCGISQVEFSKNAFPHSGLVFGLLFRFGV